MEMYKSLCSKEICVNRNDRDQYNTGTRRHYMEKVH